MRKGIGGAVYSVGHSNHALERFIELLREFGIQVLADVRSHPHSGFAPHFNTAPLRAVIERAGLKYVFLGHDLGGQPSGDRFYDASGHVRYDEVASCARFRDGIRGLLDHITKHRVALMCSEEDPRVCHRYLLIARVLDSLGVQVLHIRGDGRLQTREELEQETARERGEAGQLTLFPTQEQTPWRSTRSVSPKRARRSSSEH